MAELNGKQVILVGLKGDKGDGLQIDHWYPDKTAYEKDLLAGNIAAGELVSYPTDSVSRIYQISGSQSAGWLATIVGMLGQPGSKGDKGDKGDQGKSAYELAVENGYSGSEEDWLASIGDSAVEIGSTFTISW